MRSAVCDRNDELITGRRDDLAACVIARTVRSMFSVRKGDRVGIKELGGKVSGPYVVTGFSGFDVEVTCVRTGRRMVVLQSDLCQYSGSR